ncbi:NDP-hexose 2,3-dehydratase family protein [Streptomyces roseoverticillatus]|uniref:NDP-hexose 2,3-dehydratase family protein n=1 Tax=Streptomyces roseoverticillatus TaxID=66429 RepID=UPI00340A86FE
MSAIRRLEESARALDSSVTPNGAFREWFAEQRRTNRYAVDRIPFADLVGWRFDDDGDLVHETGRFFSVEGLRVRTAWEGRDASWSQPIINQPEVGILGILVKEFDGVLHCLMQAKMEPGNLDTVQLSPTVQATRSNYTGAHRGAPVRYIEYFAPPRRGRVLYDSLQSEQGAWFLRKRNRNMVVEATGDVPDHEDFRWLTIGQIHQLLQQDNVVNMDARTVLACIPLFAQEEQEGGAPHGALHTDDEVLGWLTETKACRELVQRSIPLSAVERWYRTEDEIGHEEGHHFTVVAASVRATGREVTQWTQPLLAPVEQGLAAFVTRRIGGVRHVLVRAETEAGVLDVAELAPTVQCLPEQVRGLPPGARPRYFDVVTAAAPSRVLYDAVQSEEGGRFHHADNRYRIVEVGEEFPVETDPDFRWVGVGQLAGLLRHSNYVNIQARTLLACLRSRSRGEGRGAGHGG